VAINSGSVPQSVLFVVLDCARSKSIPGFGGPRVARMPNINHLAREGVSFLRAVAPSNWTIPSHASMLSGSYPWDHRARTLGPAGARFSSVAKDLETMGIRTALFTEQDHLAAGIGLESGFQTIYSASTDVYSGHRTLGLKRLAKSRLLTSEVAQTAFGLCPSLAAPICLIARRRGLRYKTRVEKAGIPRRFSNWVLSHDPHTPFLALVNIVNAHEPFVDAEPDSPNEYVPDLRSWTPRLYAQFNPRLRKEFPLAELEAAYLKALEDADRKLGLILDSLRNSRNRESTWIVVTSDHGQQFGEGGLLYHGIGVTDAVCRVPLLIVPPPARHRQSICERWVSLTETPSWLRAMILSGDPDSTLSSIVSGSGTLQSANHYVYCEGAPPSDYYPVLRALPPEGPWNRRLQAAFGPEGKFVLDERNRIVHYWPPGVDPDSTPPLEIPADGFSDACSKVFPQHLRSDPQILAGQIPEAEHRLGWTVEHRLSSWGYD
jgi:hypothetical protein